MAITLNDIIASSLTEGPQGNQGNQGSQGQTGAQGNQGLQGPSGGAQGDQGFQGFQGNQGNQGNPALSDYINVSTTTTLSLNSRYLINTNSGPFTVTLPATPSTGNFVQIVDGDSFETNNLTVARNGNTIEGVSSDLLVDIGGLEILLVYNGSTWEFTASIGPTGAQGYQGTQGYQGFQGFQGLQGPSDGAQGFQGFQGPADGFQGAIGAQGAQGNQGLQGATGTQGNQGNQGTQGAQGVQGAQGFQGFQGLQGPADGAQGFQGLQGDQGAQGATSGDTAATPSTLVERDSTADVYANNFYSTSDITLKTNVKVMQNTLEKIKYINGVSYNFIGSERSQIGLIAQEVEKIFPEVVSKNELGYKTISYGHLVSVMFEAVKELDKKIEEIKR